MNQTSDRSDGQPPSLILFPHIPKTAGTSLISVFGNIFGEKNVCRLKEKQGEDPRPRIRAAAQSHIFVIGHISARHWPSPCCEILFTGCFRCFVSACSARLRTRA